MSEGIFSYLGGPGITTPTGAVSNGSIIAGLLATVGAVATGTYILAEKLSNQRITVETWENKEAPGSLDRFRRQFSDSRKGLKKWYKRHKKDIQKASGLAIVGGLVVASQLLNLPPPDYGFVPEEEQKYFLFNGYGIKP